MTDNYYDRGESFVDYLLSSKRTKVMKLIRTRRTDKNGEKMKRTSIVSALLCLSLFASGCAGKPRVLSSEVHASTSATATTEASTNTTATGASNTEAVTGPHDVKVEDLSKDSYTDEYKDTYTSVYPKLIVDGKEATEINESLKSHIQKTYPLREKTEYGYLEGSEVSYVWGVNSNVVSIVIEASGIKSDYFTSEAFNYDLDTLKPLDDSEVVKRLGMTDDEFFKKTAEILKKECGNISDYDLDKTLASVNYDNITPFITSEGTLGVVAGIYFAADSQFGGLVSVRSFDIKTMKRI